MVSAKYQRIELGIIQNVTFKLIVPTKHNTDQYPKYYLEYYHNGVQKQITKNIKNAYLAFAEWVKKQPKMGMVEKVEKLKELYQVNINQVISDFNIEEPSLSTKKLTIYTPALNAINVYFAMQQEQHLRGELADITNYKDRNKRLNEYFGSHVDLKEVLLKELNADIWDEFRTFLRGQKLANSSINQYMTYVRSFYLWLIDYKELAIANHTRKLKKLDTSQQESKFKELSNETIKEYFETLEGDGDRWLRLNILTRLVAENTVRPIQVRLIQAKHIDLKTNEILLFDKKGKKWRTIIITDYTKSLVQKVYNNTIAAGKTIEPNDFLIGGHNQFKRGLPYSQRLFRQLQVIKFRNKYPKFKDVQNYDFKHTTITRTSQSDLVGAQKRAGHAKASTTQIYDKSDTKSRAISLTDILEIGRD